MQISRYPSFVVFQRSRESVAVEILLGIEGYERGPERGRWGEMISGSCVRVAAVGSTREWGGNDALWGSVRGMVADAR